MGNNTPPLDPSAFPSSTGASHWLNKKAEISLLRAGQRGVGDEFTPELSNTCVGPWSCGVLCFSETDEVLLVNLRLGDLYVMQGQEWAREFPEVLFIPCNCAHLGPRACTSDCHNGHSLCCVPQPTDSLLHPLKKQTLNEWPKPWLYLALNTWSVKTLIGGAVSEWLNLKESNQRS